MDESPDTLLPLPARDAKGHKGTFGTVAIVGGCANRPSAESPAPSQMVGGPSLAAVAALRSGAGLARLALPEPLLSAGLAIAPSATGIALAVDGYGGIVPHLAAAAMDALMNDLQALVVGPGLGAGDGPRAIVMRAIAQDEAPLVLDADGLNALADMAESHRDFRAAAILTPHVGEFRRLAENMSVVADPATDPIEAAGDLARKLGCVVVLKSACTVVTDGLRHWKNDDPNSALATGGSGDVLAGMIGGLVAQHYRRPLGFGDRQITSEKQGGLSLYDCARLAVRGHALAARQWVESTHAPAGLLATDLLERIPAALQLLRAKGQ